MEDVHAADMPTDTQVMQKAMFVEEGVQGTLRGISELKPTESTNQEVTFVVDDQAGPIKSVALSFDRNSRLLTNVTYAYEGEIVGSNSRVNLTYDWRRDLSASDQALLTEEYYIVPVGTGYEAAPAFRNFELDRL